MKLGFNSACASHGSRKYQHLKLDRASLMKKGSLKKLKTKKSPDEISSGD
jgi:hypothetical protein